MITGSLDSKSSFTVADIATDSMLTTEVSPGMFAVTGYTNLECSPSVTSYLFVRPPQSSGLKYLSFFLGAGEFSPSEISETCSVTIPAITKHIQMLDADASVKANLDQAVSIAKTFTTK